MSEIQSIGSPIIYQMESSSEQDQQQNQDQNQNYSHSLPKSKQNQNKQHEHQQQTEVSQRPIDNYQTTEIIKVKSSLQQIFQENHSDGVVQNQTNQLLSTVNPKLQPPESIIFSQSSEENIQENYSQQQDHQMEQPEKLNPSKKRRQRSATKKRRLQNRSLSIFDVAKQDTNKLENKMKDRGISEEKANDRNIQLKQDDKIASYLQFEESQRYFDIERQFKGLTKLNKVNKICKGKQEEQGIVQGYDDEIEYNGSQQQQSIAINAVSHRNNITMFNNSLNHNRNSQTIINNSLNRSIKVLKNLPKQIIIQTTLQTLINNPIPKGMKITCTFQIQKRFMGLSLQYNLRLNSTNKIVLSAKKQHFSLTSTKFIISTNSNYITKRKDNNAFIGRLIANFSGTHYQLTKSQKYQNSNQPLPKIPKKPKYPQNEQDQDQEQDLNEILQATIQFESNLWGYGGMRSMYLQKLNTQKLSEKDKAKRVGFEQIYERREMNKIMKIQTCKPTYNKQTKRYSIDFGNKVQMPSVKNIILQYKLQFFQYKLQNLQEERVRNDSNDKGKYGKLQENYMKINGKNGDESLERNKQSKKEEYAKCLLMAKQKEDRYLVEVGYPLSLYEAFGACLANIDSKLLVN